MRIQFQIMMFAIFFNIALFFIASTGFFPHTFYGDTFTYNPADSEYDLSDTGRIPPNEILERLWTNSATGEIAEVPYVGIAFTYGYLMLSIVTIGVAISIVAHSLVPVGLMIVGLLFTVMWANSHDVIYKLTTGLHSSIDYLILMFLLGVMISFVILIYDTASGQKSTK